MGEPELRTLKSPRSGAAVQQSLGGPIMAGLILAPSTAKTSGIYTLLLTEEEWIIDRSLILRFRDGKVAIPNSLEVRPLGGAMWLSEVALGTADTVTTQRITVADGDFATIFILDENRTAGAADEDDRFRHFFTKAKAASTILEYRFNYV